MTAARHPITAAALLAAVALTACGGGGGGPDLNVEGRPLADIEPNSILLSDMHFTDVNGTRVRVSDVSCTPSGFCEMTVSGRTVRFQIDEDDDDDDGVSGTVYSTLGDWNDMAALAVYGRVDGITARYAGAGGVEYPNSLPSIGSATWRGDMVGLDDNIRGEFYGRDAGEAGGVFERNGVVGAFGAERE